MLGNLNNETYKKRINRVIDYINKHMDKKLNLKILSEVSCFSEFHFHRVFKSTINETLNDYIQRIRVEKAANLILHNPKFSLTDIAFECGFTSSSTFSRSFKTYFNMSPREFKKDDINKIKRVKISSFNDNIKNMSHKLVNINEFHVAYYRVIGEYEKDVKKAWDYIFKYLSKHRLFNKFSNTIGIVYDNPNISDFNNCRYDACFRIESSYEILDNNINRLKIESGEYLKVEFSGKQKDIKDAYNYIYGVILPNLDLEPDNRLSFEDYSLKSDQENDFFNYYIMIPIKKLI